MENMHFSTPHIQNLFDDGTLRYYWVISLSRVAEFTIHGDPQIGVLLVDMDYFSISRMMRQINTLNNGQYYYLCDSNGQIIYHPVSYTHLDVYKRQRQMCEIAKAISYNSRVIVLDEPTSSLTCLLYTSQQ